MPVADPRNTIDPARAASPDPDSRTGQSARASARRASIDSQARLRHRVRRLTLDAVLIALALVLSIVERWIPLELIVPVPGIKLGLANIVTLFALLRLTPLDAVAILVTRSVILGLITGPTTLFFSLGGGTLALLVMWLLGRWEGRAFSLIGLSVAGAAAHNFGQILVAVVLLAEPLLLQMYLPPLLLTSIVTGALTGIGAFPVVARFPSFRRVPAERDTAGPGGPASSNGLGRSGGLDNSGGSGGRRGSPLLRLMVGILALALLAGPLSLTGCKVLEGESRATGSTSTQTTGAGPTGTSAGNGSGTVVSSSGTSAASPGSAGPGTAPTAATGTTKPAVPSDGVKYSYEFTGTFDTVIQFIGYAPDKATFDTRAKAGERAFRELNQLFDAYNDYAGVRNIKAINDEAGKAPVAVDQRIIALLQNVQQWRATLTPLVDVTLGPVISLWADYRTKALADPEQGSPPPQERLASALLLTGASDVVIDKSAGTVFLKRAGMKLDVGAVAKGYATELVAQQLASQGVSSMIINAGGSSVRLVGKPDTQQRNTWNIAIQNPEFLLHSQDYDGGEPPQTLTVIHATDASIVTSGDYQRYYQVEDQVYHHIISPQTGMPVHYYRAVTVVVRDSGLADFLSTALFLLPPDESQALVHRRPGVEALWVYADGHVEMTDGLKALADPIAGAGGG